MIGWGTPSEIALYVGRPVRTIRNWAASGAVESCTDPADGRLLVKAESARRHSETRARRRRLLSRDP